jgi:hypothetical protein
LAQKVTQPNRSTKGKSRCFTDWTARRAASETSPAELGITKRWFLSLFLAVAQRKDWLGCY